MPTHRQYQIAAMLRLAASRAGIFEGRGMPPLSCHLDDVRTGTRLFFTRDGGHHTSGWFKNPDYERCYHLSISFRDPETGELAPFNRSIAATWVDAFFGDDQRLLWCEGPKTPHGKQAQVWHYRLFCDEHWQPIKPRGEVYSRELTEAGWQSWGDLHGDEPEPSILHAG